MSNIKFIQSRISDQEQYIKETSDRSDITPERKSFLVMSATEVLVHLNNELKKVRFASEDIIEEMDADMVDAGVPTGEIVGLLNYWKVKYLIVRKP